MTTACLKQLRALTIKELRELLNSHNIDIPPTTKRKSDLVSLANVHFNPLASSPFQSFTVQQLRQYLIDHDVIPPHSCTKPDLIELIHNSSLTDESQPPSTPQQYPSSYCPPGECLMDFGYGFSPNTGFPLAEPKSPL
ncbi:hypothetical protein GEMRC1_012026 [Eukaryota sp. GEM-RC1]